MVQAQRTETMRALHDYTRLKIGGRPAAATEPAAATCPATRAPARRAAEPAEPVRATAPLPASAHGTPDDLAWSLVLDHLVFATEAEVRWLDHVETRVARAAAEQRPDGAPSGAGRTASAQGADAAPPPSTAPAGASGAGPGPTAPTGAGDARSTR